MEKFFKHLALRILKICFCLFILGLVAYIIFSGLMASLSMIMTIGLLLAGLSIAKNFNGAIGWAARKAFNGLNKLGKKSSNFTNKQIKALFKWAIK